jgi:hypothetical protein
VTTPSPSAHLRSAAPYIRMYKGKTFVVKAGGGIFADADSTRLLIEQLAILHYFGVRVVMVHGGGPQLTALSESLGLATQIVDGRRVTDEKGDRGDRDGAERTHQYAHPRHLPRSEHRRSRHQRC